jgi:hypothetical protein
VNELAPKKLTTITSGENTYTEPDGEDEETKPEENFENMIKTEEI